MSVVLFLIFEHFVHVQRLHLLDGGVGRSHALDFEEAACYLALKGGDAPHRSSFVGGHVRQACGEPLGLGHNS